MTDSDRLIKTLTAVGVLSIFVLLLTTAEPANPVPAREGYTQQVSPWNLLTSTLQRGLVLPTFDNPFSQATGTVTTTPRANTSGFIESVTGCTMAQFWKCVEANTITKYLTLNSSDDGLGDSLGGYFNVLMTNVSGTAVTGATVTVWCRSVGSPAAKIDLVRPGPVVTRGLATPQCNQGTDFLPITVPISFTGGGFPMAPSTWNNNDHGITLALGNASQKVQVSFIRADVQIDLGGAGSCSSVWDVGCQLSRLVDPVLKFFRLIINAVLFIFGFIIAVFVFIAYVIAGLFLGIVGTLLFFINPANTGNPPPVAQAMMSFFIVVMVGSMFYLIVKLIRGSGPV